MNKQISAISNECTPVYQTRCISLKAIFVGALVGLGVSFLLNLFGVAIGLTAFTTSPEGATTLAIGGFIGVTIATVVSTFLGGLVAGYFARNTLHRSALLGALYGFVTWCVALILMVLFAAHLSQFVAQYNNSLNRGVMSVSVVDDRSSPSTPMVTTTNRTENSTHVTVNADKASTALGAAAFVTFFLFFIGALASCLGGHCGIGCRGDDLMEKNTLS
jgi:LytS/YehU family sensor histidine kinase